jgi:sulfatase modifying factor 1
MRTIFLLFGLCFYVAVSAQQAVVIADFLNRVLPDFKYRQELKNCVLIPNGEYMTGVMQGADSITLGHPVKRTISDFLISKLEVRNKDYRKFVIYVRDSIAHSLLGHFRGAGFDKKIDWSVAINWKDDRLDPINIPPEDRIYARKEVDANKIIYKTINGNEIAVYPDTLVWIRDFRYSYNEPMVKRYFSHPAFGNYPVVGVSRLQALAYCDWVARRWNDALSDLNDTADLFVVRLPTAVEWEYAAAEFFTVKDSMQVKLYKGPWGPAQANRGYKYNFGLYFDEHGQIIKEFATDGFFYTAPCNIYKPNKYGLYNMEGNVAEWTSSNGSYMPAYNAEGQNEELRRLIDKFPNSPFRGMKEPEINAYLQKLAIVKGGAWSTEGIFYLQPGANQYYSPDDSPTSYIGFRIAVNVAGRPR